MNRAFYIIAIPAVATTFGWLAFGWGWRVATIGTGALVIVGTAAVVFLVRRHKALKTTQKNPA